MNPFSYVLATEYQTAQAAILDRPAAKFIAGGTNLLDLMKEGVETPPQLVDINRLPLEQIEIQADGSMRLGALSRNSNVAYHPTIQARYPVLSEAILSGASPQLRNMATTAGNLMQRTRCYYFNDSTVPCNKRVPGSGCPAISGFNRIHSILGTSEQCIATHPSDMCVALVALDAIVHIQGSARNRTIPLTDFHHLPRETPHLETVLEPGELITAVEIPVLPFAARSHYLKVRDRNSYAFALVSAAVALEIQNNKISAARVAFGGVATKPWRDQAVEHRLVGADPTEETFRAAAEIAVRDAVPQRFNAFKIELTKRTLVRALTQVVAMPGETL
ncbi:MAG: xanthine dehydrogenase family protein subunit M [Stigonema ocellatum SAG 48.90 = DSM 106950]|nr:xanthine dehydrogenase family protein subunit M [Stigonema ocellatum SAG 48.90 = DSM 106950]